MKRLILLIIIATSLAGSNALTVNNLIYDYLLITNQIEVPTTSVLRNPMTGEIVSTIERND